MNKSYHNKRFFNIGMTTPYDGKTSCIQNERGKKSEQEKR